MKTQIGYQKTAIVLAVSLALVFAAYPAGKLSELVNQQPQNAAAAGPVSADAAIAIFIPASESSAMTNTVAGLHTEPDSGSEVVEWLMPGMSIGLLGRSADGAYFAVSGGVKNGKVVGWIAAKDMEIERTDTHAIAMAKVYRQPDTGDGFSNMLTYGQAITVLGTSSDGAWSAVAKADGNHKLIGWVLTSELQTEPR